MRSHLFLTTSDSGFNDQITKHSGPRLHLYLALTSCDRITRGVCNRPACCQSDREASKAAGVETNPWNLPSTPPAVTDKRPTVRACQLTSFGLEVWDPVHDDVVQKQGLVVDLDVTREQTTEILHIPTAKQKIITNNISKTNYWTTLHTWL